MLDGIESNIEAMERHIYRLKTKRSSLGINGATGTQYRLAVQQLATLEDTLELLKTRRLYASVTTVH